MATLVGRVAWAAGGAVIGHIGGKRLSGRKERKEEAERCEKRQEYIATHKNLKYHKVDGTKIYPMKNGEWAYKNGDLADPPRPPSSGASSPNPNYGMQMQQQGSYFPLQMVSPYPPAQYQYPIPPAGPQYNPGLSVPGQGANASYYSPGSSPSPRSRSRRRRSGSSISDCPC